METVAKEYGHEILRLPPYHCEPNPIQLAWAAEKNYVAGENKDMSLDSVEKLFRKKREELPEDFWRKCAEHVKKILSGVWVCATDQGRFFTSKNPEQASNF